MTTNCGNCFCSGQGYPCDCECHKTELEKHGCGREGCECKDHIANASKMVAPTQKKECDNDFNHCDSCVMQKPLQEGEVSCVEGVAVANPVVANPNHTSIQEIIKEQMVLNATAHNPVWRKEMTDWLRTTLTSFEAKIRAEATENALHFMDATIRADEIRAQARQSIYKELIDAIEGAKKKRKPTHGGCCTCQTCGYPNDYECQCERNRNLDEATQIIKQKQEEI